MVIWSKVNTGRPSHNVFHPGLPTLISATSRSYTLPPWRDFTLPALLPAKSRFPSFSALLSSFCDLLLPLPLLVPSSCFLLPGSHGSS